MTEYSFPVEEQPLPGAQWRSVTLGIGSGVLDEGGAPYRLINLDNATNSVTVAVDSITKYAHAILHGFYHKIDKNVPLTIPAVTTATTYYIALQLDTTRATAGDLPVKLGVHTSLDRTQDKDYLVLHRIVRQPNQLLSDAAFTKMDVKIAPQLVVDEFESLPDPASVLWGSTAIVRLPHGVTYQSRGDSGGRYWLELSPEPDWEDLSVLSQVQWAGHGQRPQILRDGNRREVRGRLSRTAGINFGPGTSSTGNAYHLATIPARDRPGAGTVAGVGQVSGFNSVGYTRVELSSTTGYLTSAASQETSWVGLDGFSWYVK